MYNSPYPFNQYINTQPQYNSGRILFVTNIDEAKATPADMLGNPIFFYNKAANCIYVKQTDATGAAPIREYQLVKPPEQASTPSPLEQELRAIHEQLNALNKKLEKTKEKPVSKKGNKDAKL